MKKKSKIYLTKKYSSSEYWISKSMPPHTFYLPHNIKRNVPKGWKLEKYMEDK